MLQGAIDSDLFMQFEKSVNDKANFTRGYWIKKYSIGSGKWDLSKTEYLRTLHYGIKKFQFYNFTVFCSSINTGRWYYYDSSNTKKQFKSSSDAKWVVKEDSFKFCFVPFADIFGEVEFELAPVYIINGGVANIYGTESVKIIVKINATNDKPLVLDQRLEVTAFPYNMSGFTNTGALVSDLVTKNYGGKKRSVFADKDKDTLGKKHCLN